MGVLARAQGVWWDGVGYDASCAGGEVGNHVDSPGQGFKLTFTFGPNDFFEDSVLTKEFHGTQSLERCASP